MTKAMTIEYPAEYWKDYELIDSGRGEKLERFGKYVLRRPEPKALWAPSLPESEWKRQSHVVFRPGAGFGKAGKEDSGTWEKVRKMDDQWSIAYNGEQDPETHAASDLHIALRLGLTSFKHVAAGADVTHLDSVRQVVTWARENMERSGLDGVRWVVEDALKFAKREAKRGNRYQGIILDPPAYGHGPDGEKWKLDEDAGRDDRPRSLRPPARSRLHGRPRPRRRLPRPRERRAGPPRRLRQGPSPEHLRPAEAVSPGRMGFSLRAGTCARTFFLFFSQ